MMRVTDHNLHTLSCYNAPLCIECTACGHRGCADRDVLEAFGDTSMHGSMTPLRSFRFRCSNCSGREVALWLSNTRAAAALWVNGAAI